jgi:non-ribosomal peptide synthase protein (TIGR01720 family)
MLPGHYVQLEALPLNSNGKIDRQRLPEPEGLGMSTGVAYEAPRDEMERQVAAVYEEVLKKERVGIHEDFFVLGGDSIKSIQIVSRMKQRGYSLSIQDVMLYPVVEDLARRVKAVSRTIGQEEVEGVIPLSPIQEYFFQHSSVDKHHNNQSVLLRSRERLSEEGIRMVMDKLVLHHDALRMVFRSGEGGWIQENKGVSQGYTLEVLEAKDRDGFIGHCERIQSGIDLERGPLVKVGLFRQEEGDLLLLVIHHLVVDGVSWRILLEDLLQLYRQYLSGQSLSLPLKTDSFVRWQQHQAAYAESEELRKEEDYWSAIEGMGIRSLPKDAPGGSNLVKDILSCSFALDEEVTGRLLTQCYKAYHTEINDILLTALSLSVGEAMGMEKVVVNLEGHGREHIGGEVDVTRTVGWFTTLYPVVFDLQHRGDSIRQLIETKEHLRRVPNKGIGYGILRYLGKRPYVLEPEILFNYMGDFGYGLAPGQGEGLFELSGEYRGREASEERPRPAVLHISGMVTEGQLRMSISYSCRQYLSGTIQRLASSYQRHLEALIDRLSTEQQVHLSPADLTYKGLSVEQLQKLNKLLC